MTANTQRRALVVQTMLVVRVQATCCAWTRGIWGDKTRPTLVVHLGGNRVTLKCTVQSRVPHDKRARAAEAVFIKH